jgi:membrane protein DedA with SNARE-associated domain
LIEHLALFVEHWGYPAIVTVVVLGNIGLPVPEEAILTLAGYLVWRGDLRLWLVLILSIASASVGDNSGYWLGRTLGSAAVRRYGTRVWVSPARLAAAERFVRKYGARAVFVARFLPGLRFLAGPVAGMTGMPAPVFFIANVLGASCYVPVVILVGYAAGRGVGAHLEHLGSRVLQIEYVVLAAMLLGTLGALVMRARRLRTGAGIAARPDDASSAATPQDNGRRRVD